MDTLDQAVADAIWAINFAPGHPLYQFGRWRLFICGPWDIKWRGNETTWQAIAEPYNATGRGLDRAIEGLGPTALDAVRDLIAKLIAHDPETRYRCPNCDYAGPVSRHDGRIGPC